MTLILLLATTLMMAFTQPTSAQIGVPQPEKTVGFATVAPTLIGVGQTLTCNLWVNPLPTLANDLPGFYGFSGVTVTFTRPDGTKDTFMPTDGTGAYVAGQTQSLGAIYFYYVPQMAGNWSVSFTMPAQNITDLVWYPDYGNSTTYLGCTSSTFYFTVQTDAVLAGLLNGYPWAQLPNSNVYWDYPINDNNREWTQISGDWTGVTSTMASVNSPTQLRWQPYGSGPNTAHIVWKDQVKEGGIIGGSYGSLSYVDGQNTVIVMDGMVFTNVPNTTPFGQYFSQFQAWDQSTGKLLYTANGTITCGIHQPNLLGAYQQSTGAAAAEGGQVLLESSYGHYMYPFLWGTVTINGIVYWNYYDALSGVLIRQYSNCGSARLIDGDVLAFGAQSLTSTTDTALNGYAYRWNATKVATSGANAYQWNTGIEWKTLVPIPVTGGVQSAPGTGVASTYRGPTIFAVSADESVIVIGNQYQVYNAYNAATGASLWNLTLNYQTQTNEELQLALVDQFMIWNPTACAWNGYSIKTGALLWTTPSVASDSWVSSSWASSWSIYYCETNDLNNVYIATPDGVMYAYSLTDGHLVWHSTPFLSDEYPNNAIPFVCTGTVFVDGKIYTYAGYSTSYQIDPVSRFSMMVCINATTGNTIYTLNGGIMPSAAANGYVIGSSQFDGQMYCLGKGPTSTTVTAQQQVGGSVLVQGSVLDKSPASSDATLTAMFANGVPAISDANMSVWMDYLHMQNSTLLNTPPAVNGVPVSLTAVDPNGNYMNIGTVTSDGSGFFNYQWTPTTQGLYKVYATFAGSDSYFSSYAVAGATVSIASASTTTPAPTSTASSSVSNSDIIMYLAIAVVAIIIAIAIATVLMLRKK